MKKYEILKSYTICSTKKLKRDVESIINEKHLEGYEIVSVSFGINIWMLPTAFVTICK